VTKKRNRSFSCDRGQAKREKEREIEGGEEEENKE
jgi:hypothetical protein